MKNNLSTVYKRELKLQFSSLAGWLFVALNVAALTVSAVWLCLKNNNPSYQYVPETSAILLCFTTPLLYAMTVGAEWKRGETQMILRYASSVTVTLGKYLAALTLFAVPAVVCAILPLVMIPFGMTFLISPYMGVVTYALVGVAIIALSFFIASLIKHPVIGAVVSVAVSLLLNVASNAAKIVGGGQSVPFVLAAVLIVAAVTVVMLVCLNNAVIPSVFAVLSSVGLMVVALTGNASAVVRPILTAISPQYAFYENIYGTFSLRGIVQPLLFAAVFLVFTALNHANYNKTMTLSVANPGKEEARKGAESV